MRVILHIGTEKTGTTAIQNFLHEDRKRLIERGFNPGCAIDPIFGRNNFALALAATPSPNPGLLKFRKTEFPEYRNKVRSILKKTTTETASEKCLVFSAEHLSSQLVSREDILGLKSLFEDGAEFTIVCYIRPQHELLLGAQAESIKAGRSNLRFNDPRGSAPDRRYGIIYYDYDRMLSLWEDVFGLEKMVVVPFEKETLVDADIVSDFAARVLKVEPGPIASGAEQTANQRLSAEALFVLAKLNERDGAKTRENLALVSGLDDGRRSVLIDPHVLREFVASFEESNRNVALRYLGREALFDHVSIESEHFDLSDRQRVEDALITFLQRMISGSSA